MDDKDLALLAAKLLDSKKAKDISIIDIAEKSGFADYFVIATANSEPQLRAVADFIDRKVRENFHLHAAATTESSEGGWKLLDFGNVIVHVMTPEMRSRYNLEGLWGDAEKLRGMRPERI